MKHIEMLERMSWNCKNIKNDIEKIERITANLRGTLAQNQSSRSVNSQYWDYWKYIAKQNLFICSLLINRLERIYGADDICIIQGRRIIQKESEYLNIDDIGSAAWHLLSEIEMQSRSHIIEYVRYLLTNDRLSQYIKYLQYSSRFVDDVVFFIHSCCIADVEFRKSLFKTLNIYKWSIDNNCLSNDSSKNMLTEIVNQLWQWNDISGLSSILTIFEEASLSELLHLRIDEIRNYLLSQKQPLSMMLYRIILSREGLSVEETINELYKLTYWDSQIPETCVNDYLFLAYAIVDNPEKYDEIISMLDTKLYSDQTTNIEIEMERIRLWNDILQSDNGRWFNYRLIDKPFISLIKNNPLRVIDYLERMSKVSLYNTSRSLLYRKNQTWIPNNYLPDYRNFFLDYAKLHSKQETMDLYMSSPLKAQIDFSFVIRLLFQPQEGFVFLTDILDQYTLRGKVVKKENAERNISFQVTVSNVTSSYRFPIHHSWLKYHYEEIEQFCNDETTVYYKIMSVNSKGMIFVHDLVKKPHSNKKVTETAIQIETKAFKYLDRIIDGTLNLQSNNIVEDIQLFVLAMICDDETILVERRKVDNSFIDSLPVLSVSNQESTDETLRRLLKYSLGFQEDFAVSPCGIRHICIGNNKRYMIFIYKIQISNCLELQKNLVIKQTLLWRNIEQIEATVHEKTTESILFALRCPWSEFSIILPDNSSSMHRS